MRNFKLFRIIAFMAVIGYLVLGCGDPETPASCTHSWDWVTTKHPTAAEEGVETYTCLHCAQTGTTRPIPVTSSVISVVSISITAPVNGVAPNNAATTTDSGYTLGTVSWTPTDNPFLGGKEYTATVLLTANNGYTFTGLNTANINGQSGAVTSNIGTNAAISYTFPLTPTKTVSSISIKTQPDKLTYTHSEHLDLTGLVVSLNYDDTTTEDVSAANFTGKNISANPAHGNVLDRATHNGNPVIVTYGNLTQDTNNIIVNNKSIANVEIDITAPVKNASPTTTAIGTGDYSIGTVTWSPVHNKFLGGEIYTASVILTANSGFVFTGLTSATINGQSNVISNNTGSTITLIHTFSKTDERTVNDLVIKSQPTKLTYTHGNHLDLTGLVVTLTHDDGTTEDVIAANLNSKNINAIPAGGNTLVRANHNGHPVLITYGELTAQTNNLIVNPKVITFSVEPISTVIYTGIAHSPVVVVYDNDLLLTLGTDYTVGYANNINAGNATVTVTGAGNYEGSSGNITFIINKASGAIVSAPTLALITRNSITINAVTAPNNGQIVEYSINTSTTTPITGWQTGLTFGGLSFDVTYYIFARSASNNNYNAGTPIFTQIHSPNTGISFGDPSIKLFLDGSAIENGGTTTFNQTTGSFTVSIESGTGTGTESSSPIQLLSGNWLQGSITSNASGASVWYSFPVTSGVTYRIWWNSRDEGSGGNRSLSVRVSADYVNGSWIFSGVYNGWNTPQQFTANQTGIVKVRVQPAITGHTGTFGIVFTSNDNTRPVLWTGEYSEIIWYLNGNIVAQGASKTSIALSKQTPGVYQLTVEAVPAGGVKNSGRHNFIIQ